MSRIKIELPEHFSFTTLVPVRITDINYGGHMGNDSILSLLHEARMQFLTSYGFTEMNLAGSSMIMADVGIEFKSEAFYGDIIEASVTARQVSKVSFDLFYKLAVTTSGKNRIIAIAKTAMVCYNYDLKKIVSIPETAFTIFKGKAE